MRTIDSLQWITRAVTANRLRTLLTALGIAIGISAVAMLTSIGEGLRIYMMDSFSQFGTHLIKISPGKNQTLGMAGILSTIRPLTIADSEALRSISQVEYVVPLVTGTGRVTYEKHARSSDVFGVGHEGSKAWDIGVSLGRFLPEDDPGNTRPFAVIGSKMRTELFGTENPLGKFIHISGMRFRVIGVTENKGQFLGMDLDDVVYIPADRALAMYNRDSLQEIDVTFSDNTTSAEMSRRIFKRIKELHGEEDVTLFTQDDMLGSLDRILSLLQMAIGAMGSISLLVGGVGVMTIMTTALRERTPEIGLLRALGTTRQQLLLLFLGEAVVLATLGGLLGLSGVMLLIGFLKLVSPTIPIVLHPMYIVLSLLLSAVVGLAAGITPAWRASQVDPIVALREE